MKSMFFSLLNLPLNTHLLILIQFRLLLSISQGTFHSLLTSENTAQITSLISRLEKNSVRKIKSTFWAAL